jgi:hypothetical protein
MDYPYTQQVPTDTTPADVVERVIRALEAKRWADVAALVAPEDVERFLEDQVAELRELETERNVADALRQRSSLSPEVLARYARDEVETRRARRARFAEIYEGRDTSAELARLGPEALFLLWLAASDPDEQFRRSVMHVERMHPGFTSSALQTAPAIRREIVRTEYEGTDVAHVTYREWLGGNTEEGILHVTRLRRIGGAWRMGVDAEMMGHASLWVVVEPADG